MYRGPTLVLDLGKDIDMARTEDKITFTIGEKFSLKDHLFNKKKVTHLANEIMKAYSAFEKDRFVKQVVKKFPKLELKARVEHITDCLHEFLPSLYTDALEVILRALPQALDPSKKDDDFGDFIYEPYNTFIARYGCNEKYFSLSLNALEQTTQRFSAEFALRFFIKFDEEKTLKKVQAWSKHKNYHVRRLASEGIRPNLPWGGKISTDPQKIITVLDNLYYDPTRYVVRSVANNLNDISKIDYTLVLETLDKWKKECKQTKVEFEYLTRHALRSQIKAGEIRVIQFLGYKTNISYKLSQVAYKKKVALGQYQEIDFTLTTGQSGRFMIDYVVFFRKKDGSLSGKTFKIKDVKLKKGEVLEINKKHLFREMSTKKLYAGKHAWCVQINGVQGLKHSFDLET